MQIFGLPIGIFLMSLFGCVVFTVVMIYIACTSKSSKGSIEKQVTVERRIVEKVNIKWQYVFSLFLLLLSQVVYFGGVSVNIDTLGGALGLAVLALIVFIYGAISETLEGLGEEEWFEGG